jgi:hypothetical protein
MQSLRSSDNTRCLVAEQKDGSWSVHLALREGSQWLTAAELVEPRGWPVDHAGRRHWIPAKSAEIQAGVLRLAGEGEVDDHTWQVTDEWSFAGQTVRLVRRWSHAGAEPQDQLDFLIEAHCPKGEEQRFILPGISYNGNPSADPHRLVPRFPAERPARCLYEEHRFPVPMVSCEWAGTGSRMALSLISQPCRIGPEANDHWWSLGLSLGENRTTLLAASGAVETNGQRNAVYGRQGQLEEVEGWHVAAEPGMTLQKEVLLECGKVETPGYGFRPGLWRAHALLKPAAKPALALESLIDVKLNALRGRYVEEGDVAGFLCVPVKNLYKRPRYFLWGWTGQSLRASWCALSEGRRRNWANIEQMGVRAANFFVAQPLPKLPARLVALRYFLDERRWDYDTLEGAEVVSSRQFGEAFTNLARLVERGRQLGLNVEKWLERLCWAADFLCDRSHWASGSGLPRAWTREGAPVAGPPSAAGAPCISALALAGLLTGTGRYRVAARELLLDYHRAFLADQSTPPWGSTLDAGCEDKEAGLYLFAAALDCYDSIGEGRFLEWARLAADWALTFTYVWHPEFPAGKPCSGRLHCVGWSSVSVQNHHLDVFAMPSLYLRLDRASGEERYGPIARMALQAVTQSIARKGHPWGFDAPGEHNVAGEQGEPFFQTNYWQGPGDRASWRGGSLTFNPLWVIALPLQEAILMREAGVTW